MKGRRHALLAEKKKLKMLQRKMERSRLTGAGASRVAMAVGFYCDFVVETSDSTGLWNGTSNGTGSQGWFQDWHVKMGPATV